MPLSSRLREVTFSHSCPFCAHEIRKRGAWFHSTIRYKCVPCRRLVPLDHADKVRLAMNHVEVNVPKRFGLSKYLRRGGRCH